MPALTIKNIPDCLYDSLKERARANHRSLNGEVISCLEQALGTRRVDAEALLVRIERLRRRIEAPKLTNQVLRRAKEEGRL